MKKFFTLLSFLLGLGVANAQTLIVEDFNFAAGDTIRGVNGWVFVNSNINPISVVAPGLTFADYPGSGVGNAGLILPTGQDLYKETTSPITSGSAYASFMVRVDSAKATGDYFFSFLPSTSTTTFAGRIFIKSATGGFNFGISKAASGETPTYGTTVYNYGTTYVVVLKYAFNAGTTTDDQISLFVFDGTFPATEPGTPTIGPITATQSADLSNIARVVLRQGTGSNAPGLTIDGIRFSNDWSTTLPVKLASFNAAATNNTVALNWNTASEENVHAFNVERSIDGKSFEAIATVAAKNSANGAAYTYNDVLRAGVTYYRLKMVDKDGSFAYSKVVSVNGKAVASIDVYPNPVRDRFVISHPKTFNGATVDIFTLNGKKVMSQNAAFNAEQTTIDAAKLVAGTYIVVLNNGEQTLTTKLVKL